MEINLSLSGVKPKTYNMTAADTLAAAQELLPKLRRRAKGSVAETELKTHAAEVVADWVRSTKAKFSPEARSKSAKSIANKMLGALKQEQRKPKVNTGDPKRDLATSPSGRQRSVKELEIASARLAAKANALKADDVTSVAESLLPKLRAEFQGRVSERTLKVAAATAAESWAMNTRSKEFPEAARLNAVSRIATKLESLFKKKSTGDKKAPVKAPADKVVATGVKATKEERQKAQIMTGTKLRNQFQGMLAKAPPMTAKSIENIRKHCVAYNKVITSVQRGNEALAETTKVEGIRGIDSVKNYVNSVLGMTYGYVELAKVMAGTQADFKARVMGKLKPEEMTKVDLRRKARENAQFALMNFTKQLGKRQCRVPQKFTNDMQRIFSTAVESGDFKTAKADARALIDTLVADVFSNKVKMYSAK